MCSAALLSQCLKRHLVMSKTLLRSSVCTVFKKNSSSLTIEQLNERGLLRVSGKESSEFLQGLITNDIRHLKEGTISMYTLFLNTKGRVLYDSIIYQTPEENVFIVECDVTAVEALQRHMKLYRVRRKIDIDNVGETLKVWAVFNPDIADEILNNHAPSQAMDNVVANNFLAQLAQDARIKPIVNDNNSIMCRDPRLPHLGARIILPADIITSKLANTSGKYREFRYKLGVGEGVEDLPPGKSFPLEANGDYLHGISFHKGCYIGQELTARTHHTGVVRKRLMPIIFDVVPKDGFKPDTPIAGPNSCSQRPLGKLRGGVKNIGLGLVKVTEALDSSIVRVMDGTGQARKPSWWPQEARKDRITPGKEETN